MYPKAFEYARAESVRHAVELLARYGPDAKLLAGGASLIPLMKLRLASPSFLVDIGRLSELSFVRRQNGALMVGALTRHAEVESDAVLRAELPVLAEVAAQIGDTQVRNMGTLGGSLAEADPAGDWAPAVLALGGTIVAVGPRGERTIAASDLFVDAYTTSLEPDEVITQVRFPLWGARAAAAHLKLERRAGDFAVANCCVAVQLDEAGRCQRVGIGLGGVGLCPVKVSAAEALLRGQVLSAELVKEAARLVSTATEAFSDVRATAEYRQHVAGVLFQRAIERARARVEG